MKTKEQVYVVIDSEKKAKKLAGVLEMFGQKVFRDSMKRWKSGTFSLDGNKGAEFNSGLWIGTSYYEKENKEVTIKELRNILALELLNAGDVIIVSGGDHKYKWIVQVDKVEEGEVFPLRFFTNNFQGFDGVEKYDEEVLTLAGSFLRYATEEEKALLLGEPKRELEVGKWYKFGEHGLYCHTNNYRTYGFGDSGAWSERIVSQEHDIEATEEEVKQALERECVKRYGEDWRNVKIKAQADGRTTANMNSGNFGWYIIYDGRTSIYNRNGEIYSDGKWAEPIYEDNSITAQDIGALERLHDTLHDNHGYTLESRLLTEARKVIDKLRK